MRHTFAKAALLAGQDMRSVAAWLRHREMGTTMIYTEQDALDLIRYRTRFVTPPNAANARSWQPIRVSTFMSLTNST